MTQARVLVVEDDPAVQERYQWLFEQAHRKEFTWVLAPNGQRALLVLENHPSRPIDIVVLDWMLPDMEGLQILKRIKADPATRDILVLMVTAMQSAQNAAQGLDAGADDYLRKDFADEEFIARLHNFIRRRDDAVEKQADYSLDGLSLDSPGKLVTFNGSPLRLRPKEFTLLKLFLARPDMTHSQARLGDLLSEGLAPASPETVRRQVSNLRQALGPWGERIEAYRGEGYRLHTRFPVSQG